MTSRLVVDTIQASTLGGNMVTIPTGQSLYAPGHIIQMFQTVKNNLFSSNSTSFIDLPGLSVSINPKSINSKIMVSYNVHTSIINGGYGCMLRLLRNDAVLSAATGQGGGSPATTIAYSDNNAASLYPVYIQNMSYLDSPGTVSTLTYRLQVSGWQSSAGNFYINQSGAGISSSLGTAISTITVMEIGG